LPNRAEIVKTLADFKDNRFAKVYDKWHFYYNKQSIMLTNIDEDGNFIQMPTKTNKEGEVVEEKSIKLEVEKITQTTEDKTIQLDKTEYTADDILGTEYTSLDDYLENYIKPVIAELDYKEADLTVHTANKLCYYYDADKETIM
jgi:type I restriction enzyme M protein